MHEYKNDNDNKSASNLVIYLSLLRDFAKKNIVLSVVVCLLALTVSIQNTIVPLMVEKLVKNVQNHAWSQKTWWSVGFLVSSIAFVAILDVSDIWAMSMFVPKFFRFVRQNLINCTFHKSQNVKSGDIDSGEVISRFLRIPYILNDLTTDMMQLAPHVFAIVSTATYMYFSGDKIIALIMVSLAAVVIMIIIAQVRSCMTYSIIRDKVITECQSQVDDVLQNIPAILNSNTSVTEIDNIYTLDTKHYTAAMTLTKCSIKFNCIFIVALVCSVAGILYRCGVIKMKAPKLTSTFLIISLMSSTHWRLIHGSNYVVSMWGTLLHSGFPNLSCPDQHEIVSDSDVNEEKTQGTDDDAPIVAARDVSMDSMLLPTSFDLNKGDRVAIVGQMGSGKTTLMKIVIGLSQADSGSIFLDGENYHDVAPTTIKNTFAYIPQVATLFNTTVYENAIYGVVDPANRTREAVWTTAKTLGLDAIFEEMRDGIDTQVGKKGSMISGGQRQTVWLVRAWLMGRRVLAMDEPTAAMDAKHALIVSKAVQTFETIIFISHDAEFVDSTATKIVTLV